MYFPRFHAYGYNQRAFGRRACQCSRQDQTATQSSCCTQPQCVSVPKKFPLYEEPVCRKYREEDYLVETIEQLFAEYCEIEKKADYHFHEAQFKLHEAADAIQNGLNCNKEGYILWVKIETWLANYYERFGEYCGCNDRMHQIRECVAGLLLRERGALEHTSEAYKLMDESRRQDENMHILRREFRECCLPKC